MPEQVLCILHHLLVNEELYEEEGGAAQKDTLILKKKDQKVPPIEDMIQYIVQAGYEVKKNKSRIGG